MERGGTSMPALREELSLQRSEGFLRDMEVQGIPGRVVLMRPSLTMTQLKQFEGAQSPP